MCSRDQGKLQYNVWVICPYHYVIWTDEITSIAKNKSFASGAKSRSSSGFVDIESSGFCLLRILKESFISFFHKDNYFFMENVGLIYFFQIPFLTNITASFCSTNVGHHLIFKVRQNCPATLDTLVIECIAARFVSLHMPDRHTDFKCIFNVQKKFHFNSEGERTFGDI